jgi:hypothetical protein
LLKFRKYIIFILLAYLLSSCGAYEYYPDKIIRYRGKCLRMTPNPMFSKGYWGKLKGHRIKRKKHVLSGNPYKFWNKQRRRH